MVHLPTFTQVVTKAFSMRRKTLRKALPIQYQSANLMKNLRYFLCMFLSVTLHRYWCGASMLLAVTNNPTDNPGALVTQAVIPCYQGLA